MWRVGQAAHLRRARRAASRELGLSADHPDVVEHALCQIGIDQVQASVIAGRAINIEATGKLLDRQKELRARHASAAECNPVVHIQPYSLCVKCGEVIEPKPPEPPPVAPPDPKPPVETKPPAPAPSMVNVVPLKPRSIHGDGAPLAQHNEAWRGHVGEIVGQSSRDPFPTDAPPQFPWPKKGA
jgi:hypothetical protein